MISVSCSLATITTDDFVVCKSLRYLRLARKLTCPSLALSRVDAEWMIFDPSPITVPLTCCASSFAETGLFVGSISIGSNVRALRCFECWMSSKGRDIREIDSSDKEKFKLRTFKGSVDSRYLSPLPVRTEVGDDRRIGFCRCDPRGKGVFRPVYCILWQLRMESSIRENSSLRIRENLLWFGDLLTRCEGGCRRSAANFALMSVDRSLRG